MTENEIFDFETSSSSYKPKKNLKKSAVLMIIILINLVLFVIYLISLTKPPHAFHDDSVFEIENGMSVSQIVKKAKDDNFVKSELILYIILTYYHEPTELYAGVYHFPNPVTVSGFAKKIASGEIQHENIPITIPEGTRVTKIAEITKKALPNFDDKAFITLAEPYEGYLFPETYFITKDYDYQLLFELLTETFKNKLVPYESGIASSSLSLNDIVILASVIEREANDPDSMRMVSGILQNRLAINMPLQADASIEYVLDKPLNELTADDLKIESPYNTYLNQGLPPTPIGNPGLEAILAVLEPAQTDDLFYITGNDGEFYYAKTFDEHRLNIARYLK
ncbi:endolytic transglycosylase MltG [Candidatus Kaiserbacteria bacterium]|nr:endolytic transglycosylase MltG [Candidatus Kaiserbacteria bacterium]